jgi:hypothetical protein
VKRWSVTSNLDQNYITLKNFNKISQYLPISGRKLILYAYKTQKSYWKTYLRRITIIKWHPPIQRISSPITTWITRNSTYKIIPPYKYTVQLFHMNILTYNLSLSLKHKDINLSLSNQKSRRDPPKLIC